MEAGTIASAGERRSALHRSPAARLPDRVLKWGLTALSVGVIALIGFFFVKLILESRPVFGQVGIGHFLLSADWVPSRQLYGALPLLAGTLISSAIALVLGIPVAVATALYVTELAPRRVRGPLTVVVDLLAAVPSVVYGLWGFFFLIPKLQPAERWLADAFSFVPFVGGTVTGPNYFVAGLILAIMILPIASAISREVIATVPPEHKEAALALGATRWETIRMAVLPYARGGIAGGAMLGLGRAIGETIAVTLVIGNANVIGHSIFQQGYTLAAVIANEFGEAASDPLHRASLIAAGLVLFVLTLAVNAVARVFVVRAERGRRVTSPAGGPLAGAGGRNAGIAA